MAEQAKLNSDLLKAAKTGGLDDVKKCIDAGANIDHSGKDGWTALLECLCRGHVPIASYLLGLGADVNFRASHGDSPLLEVCWHGQERGTLLERILDVTENINACDDDGNAALYATLNSGNTSYVPELIKRGADVNHKSFDGGAPLHMAAREGHTDSAKLLIENKADVNAIDNEGWSPLLKALWAGNADTANLLIDNKADISSVTKSGTTPLMAALRAGITVIASTLIQEKADINRHNMDGQMALDFAKERNLGQFIGYLKTHFAPKTILFFDTEDVIHTGEDPLEQRFGKDYPVELTIRKPFSPMIVPAICKIPKLAGDTEWHEIGVLTGMSSTSPHLQKLYGLCMSFRHGTQTSIGMVMSRNHGGSLREFVRNKNDPLTLSELAVLGLQMTNGVLALHENSYLHNDISSSNFQLKAEVDGGNISDAVVVLTSLSLARQFENTQGTSLRRWRYSAPEVVRSQTSSKMSDAWSFGITLWELVSPGVVPFKQFGGLAEFLKSADSPSPVASPDGAPQEWKAFIEGLLKYDPESRTELSTVRDMLADIASVKHNCVEERLYEFILADSDAKEETTEGDKKGEDKETQANEEKSDLEMISALESGKLDIFKESIKDVVNVNTQNKSGCTAALICVGDGYEAELKILVEKSADVNTENKWGTTPLLLACFTGNTNIAKVLIGGNANVNKADTAGWTPLMWALSFGKVDAAKLLVDSGANLNVANDDSKVALDYAVESFHLYPALKDIMDTLVAVAVSTMQVTFRDFELLYNNKLLSEGNFGITFKSDLAVGCSALIPVVLKLPKLGAGQDDWFEVEVLQNVPNHPNVLQLLGICMDFPFQSKKTVVVIVPFMSGGGLDSYIKKNKSNPLLKMAEIGCQMSRGVLHLHENMYIHNDIALRNFLFSRKEDPETEALHADQRVVLADFGLSRLQTYPTDDSPRPWRWVAPETLTKKVTSVRSDVWMLGIALWELQGVGHPFLFTKTPRALVNSFQNNRVPHVFGRSTPPQWKDVVMECCQIDPQSRPKLSVVVSKLVTLVQNAKDDSTAGVPGESQATDTAADDDDDVAEYDDSSLLQEEEETTGDVPDEYLEVSTSDVEDGDVIDEYMDVSEEYMDVSETEKPKDAPADDEPGPELDEYMDVSATDEYMDCSATDEYHPAEETPDKSATTNLETEDTAETPATSQGNYDTSEILETKTPESTTGGLTAAEGDFEHHPTPEKDRTSALKSLKEDVTPVKASEGLILEWRVPDENFPKHAVIGGEEDGDTLYVARAYCDQAEGMIGGKTRGWKFPVCEHEYAANVYKARNWQYLYCSDPEKLKWKEYSADSFDYEAAVFAGHQKGMGVYVIRGYFEGTTIPGKLVFPDAFGSIIFGAGFVSVRQYDYLSV